MWARALGGVRPAWQNFQFHRAHRADRMVFYDHFPDFREAAQDVRRLYAASFVDQLATDGAHELFTFPLPWPRIDLTLTRLICDTYLRENGIAQGDRLSMASSIELRLPLVDYRLVEVVIGLRKTQSDANQPPKNWFKSALKGILPDTVINRPKRGFAPPVLDWHHALFAAYGDTLVNGYLAESGVLTEQASRLLAAGEFPATAVCAPLSFKALLLEQWCRQMLRRAPNH
jgi:asparagine synthase (glutamine-hydrolysing)